MTDPTGDAEFSPEIEEARALFHISPFTRLARTHVLSIAGDALFAIGLAGTVFFNVTDIQQARWKVVLTLVLTLGPFALAAPLIGPALDRVRGGRRWIIVGTCAGRALACVLLIQNLGSLFFYPLAFLLLVLSKGYQISKSAVVPATVRNDAELVEANSKLSLLSGLAVVGAALPGGLFWKFGGAQWVVGFAAVVFGVATATAFRVPKVVVATQPVDETERVELHSASILLAAAAMGVLRGIVGFLTFLLAFNYKGQGAWKLGVVAAMAQAGFLVGAAVAPRLKKVVEEEYILIGVLLTLLVTSFGAAFTKGLVVASLMSFTVGAGSSAGKQAFDAIVQRDAPDANRGRSFAKFETRFQLLWVIGALIPVVLHLPIFAGFLLIGLASGAAAGWYWFGLRSESGRAAALDRLRRRKTPRVAAEEVARDLGFERGMVEDGSAAGEGSAAASEGARRRRRSRRDDEAGAAEPDLDEGPDLEWHPGA